jgi:hypothetical protein
MIIHIPYAVSERRKEVSHALGMRRMWKRDDRSSSA